MTGETERAEAALAAYRSWLYVTASVEPDVRSRYAIEFRAAEKALTADGVDRALDAVLAMVFVALGQASGASGRNPAVELELLETGVRAHVAARRAARPPKPGCWCTRVGQAAPDAVRAVAAAAAAAARTRETSVRNSAVNLAHAIDIEATARGEEDHPRRAETLRSAVDRLTRSCGFAGHPTN